MNVKEVKEDSGDQERAKWLFLINVEANIHGSKTELVLPVRAPSEEEAILWARKDIGENGVRLWPTVDLCQFRAVHKIRVAE